MCWVGADFAACFVSLPVRLPIVARSPLPIMMSGLPFGLQRRLPPTYLFLAVCSAVELEVVGAFAQEWGLRLADLRLWALLQLGLLGR